MLWSADRQAHRTRPIQMRGKSANAPKPCALHPVAAHLFGKMGLKKVVRCHITSENRYELGLIFREVVCLDALLNIALECATFLVVLLASSAPCVLAPADRKAWGQQWPICFQPCWGQLVPTTPTLFLHSFPSSLFLLLLFWHLGMQGTACMTQKKAACTLRFVYISRTGISKLYWLQ